MKLFDKSYLLFAIILGLFSCKKDEATAPGSNTLKPRFSGTAFASSAPLITNVDALTTQTYQLTTLAQNITYHIDRDYLITSVPSLLTGAQLIKTSEVDKPNKSAAMLTFTLTQSATVYVAFDPRATTLPAWLQGWQKLSDQLPVNDAKVGAFNLYSKSYSAGKVSLGGNTASPEVGSLTNYIVLALAANAAASAPVAVDSSFMLGINGHSLSQQSYKSISADGQIAMLQKMGMTCFRQDMNFNSDGTISSLSLFTPLYAAAKAAGITILPMVYTKTLDYTKSETLMYAAGKTRGTTVASKNAQYFKYYELGNELDLKVLVSGNGNLTTDYDAKKFKAAAAYLKGMDDGIKSVQPDAKTMVDASWLHYAYLQMLQSYGVNFDIVAYHWYSEMEAITDNGSFSITNDITQKLSSLFPDKPIWFTEVGQRYSTVSNIDQLQSDFMTGFLAKCKKNPQVKALVFYELLNEPEKNNQLESNYGIVKWITTYTKWQYKLAAQSLFVN